MSTFNKVSAVIIFILLFAITIDITESNTTFASTPPSVNFGSAQVIAEAFNL